MLLQIHIGRTKAGTSAAADTTKKMLVFQHIGKFMQHPLSPSLGLSFSWIVAGRVEGKQRKTAGIPVAVALACLPVVHILNIETSARGTDVGTRAAAYASHGLFKPDIAFKEGV